MGFSKCGWRHANHGRCTHKQRKNDQRQSAHIKSDYWQNYSWQVRKKQIEIIWTPPSHDIDTGGEDNPRLIAWKQRAYLPPNIGTIWITTYYGTKRVATNHGPKHPYSLNKAPILGHRYPYTEDKFNWTKKYIEEGLAARKKAELQRKQKFEELRKEDLEIENKADLKKLYDDSTDIFIAKRVSGGLPFMSFQLSERFKSSRTTPSDKQNFIEVQATKTNYKMIEARVSGHYWQKRSSVILFVRVVKSSRYHPPSHLSNVDQRLYQFVDPGNGILPLTENRLKTLNTFQPKSN